MAGKIRGSTGSRQWYELTPAQRKPYCVQNKKVNRILYAFFSCFYLVHFFFEIPVLPVFSFYCVDGTIRKNLQVRILHLLGSS